MVTGGPGDDVIWAGGSVSGGPGDDDIKARTLVASRFSGGPGDDRIVGSKRRDVVDPGPGIDIIDLRGVSTRNGGGEQIDTRDGEIDHVNCFRKDSIDIDPLDGYAGDCGVQRHSGPARAIPYREPFAFTDKSVVVDCPADAPRVCAGTITLSRRERVLVHKRFRFRRCCAGSGDFEELFFQARRQKLRAMAGRLRITVRSRDRAGKLRTASGTYDFPPDE